MAAVRSARSDMVTICPRQSTTDFTTWLMAARERGSRNVSTISAISSRSRVCGSPVRDIRRMVAVVTCRIPGRVTTPMAWWKPGVVIALIAGVTSGPRPPDDTRITRWVRSGNW